MISSSVGTGQRAQLRQREVRGEPAGDRGAVDDGGAPPRGELRALRDVGGGRDVGLVPRDQLAVLRRHQVRLDHVGAELDREAIGLERVFRAVARGAAVGDHEGQGGCGGSGSRGGGRGAHARILHSRGGGRQRERQGRERGEGGQCGGRATGAHGTQDCRQPVTGP
jgi:hypothetical protein